MKRVTEQYGKTVEEAIRKGIEELKVARDEVKIEVIDEPSTGLLGMLSSKMAKVKLTYEKKLDSDAANMQYVNSVGLTYRGLTSSYNMDDPNMPQGIYEISGTPVYGVSDGLVFHKQIRPGVIAIQTVVSSTADQIWVRTYWKGTWNKFRYIGFGYGTETELPKNAQDGQLFFVNV